MKLQSVIVLICLIFTIATRANLSEAESMKLANEFKTQQTNEELGKVISAQCEVADKYGSVACEFSFDLPEDYCWYGHFEATASYSLDNHGALELDDYKVNWVE